MKEALSSSEMSVLTRSTRRNIPEDTILHRIYKTIVLSIVLYGCKTWSLTLGKNQTGDVCNRGLKGILGPNSDHVTGGWGKLYSSARVIGIFKRRRVRQIEHKCGEQERM
jgi:hypothetical protein